jgi:hypothetical protein
MIRTLKIDVISQTVSELFLLPELSVYYHEIECSCITGFAFPDSWREGQFCYVDDEGLLKTPFKGFFQLSFMQQPVAGNGIIVGTSPEGNDISTELDVATICQHIRFWHGSQALQMLHEIANNPAF